MLVPLLLFSLSPSALCPALLFFSGFFPLRRSSRRRHGTGVPPVDFLEFSNRNAACVQFARLRADLSGAGDEMNRITLV